MPDTPLNPDALEAASEAIATRNGFGCAQFSHKGDAHAAVRAYLSSLPVAPLELTNAEWQAFQAIPDQGYSHRAWVDARIAERVAVAQPEVNSVESIPAHVQVISWEEEPEHECWKLAPDETFVGLIVKLDRAWSPADRYTLNIERPEVNDGRE